MRTSDIIEEAGSSIHLIKGLEDIHSERLLCGNPRNAILRIPEELLVYIVSILKNHGPECPRSPRGEWMNLISILKPHSAMPILYGLIGRLPAMCHPPDFVMDCMRKAFLYSRVRSIKTELQLGGILMEFKNLGIRALLLKGPALSRSAYPDPAMRIYNDIDLLVHPGDMEKAGKALKDLGYEKEEGTFAFGLRRFHCEEEFAHTRRKDYLKIELHWQTHYFFSLNQSVTVPELFSRSLSVKSASFTFETLSPADAVLNSAIHMALTHRREIKLIWIYDVYLLLKRLVSMDDWRELRKRSVDWAGALALGHSLKMAEHWTDFKLPHGMEGVESWPKPKEEEISVWSNTATRRDTIENVLKIRWSGSTTLAQKVLSLFFMIFPPVSVMRKTHPPSTAWLLPLSYAKRWVNLICLCNDDMLYSIKRPK